MQIFEISAIFTNWTSEEIVLSSICFVLAILFGIVFREFAKRF